MDKLNAAAGRPVYKNRAEINEWLRTWRAANPKPTPWRAAMQPFTDAFGSAPWLDTTLAANEWLSQHYNKYMTKYDSCYGGGQGSKMAGASG